MKHVTITRSFLREKKAAEHVGKSIHWLRKMRAMKIGPTYYKASYLIYYRKKDLNQWVKENAHKMRKPYIRTKKIKEGDIA